ncbi:hypothetical protein [Ruminococcus sp.]|uniref:hypothetical protein n=1 Tax=Ruminococcus sp. TaxID=41978 RepID=UPI001B616D88|nr:hypothetical protein [Ruminococcus sp.]MBP5433399.1 hypothetical protein [Ruminococcus sp.]
MALIPGTTIEYEEKRHDEITSAYSYAPYVTAWNTFEYGVSQNPVCKWNYPTQTIHTEAGDSSVYADILWLYDPEYVFPEANILINADSSDTLNVITKLDIQQYKFKIKGFRTMYASDTGVSNTINSRTAGYPLQTNENIVDVQYCFYDIDDPDTEIYDIYPVMRYTVNGETWYFRINILFSNYIRNVPTDSNKLTVQAPDGYFTPHDDEILMMHCPVSCDWTMNFPALNNAFLCGTNTEYNIVFSNVNNGNNSLYALAASVETMLHVVATLGIYFDYNGTMYLGFMDETGQTTGEYLTEDKWDTSAQWESENINNYTEHKPPYVPPYSDEDNTDPVSTTGAPFGTGLAHYYVTTVDSAVLGQISEALGTWDIDNTKKDLYRNLISCKILKPPAGIPSTPSTFEIYGVKPQYNGADISIPAVTGNPDITFGPYTISRKFNDFRDYAPYTRAEIFLPYCGWCALPSHVVGRSVSVSYFTDVIAGTVKAVVFCEANPVAEAAGVMAYDIPFAAQNVGAKIQAANTGMLAYGKAALQLSAGIGQAVATKGKQGMSSIVNGAFGVAAGYNQLSMAANENYTEISGKAGDGCALAGIDTIIIKIVRPKYGAYSNPPHVPKGFAHTVGYLSMKQAKVSAASGLILCDNVDTSGIGKATDAERAEIKRVLETGLYVNNPPE